MKKRSYKICALLLSGVLSAAALTGCSAEKKTETSAPAETVTEASEEPNLTEGTTDSSSKDGVASVGPFTTQDINGETYTEEIFKDYDLTMVNLFTTWCSPCVNEIPELQKLKDEMADKGVNVVGVVLDASDVFGDADDEALEKAKLIAEKTGVSYTFLLPDETYMNGRLDNIDSVPETFFVDKDGNIVGETYVGSNDLEGWKAVVEQELANLKGAE